MKKHWHKKSLIYLLVFCALFVLTVFKFDVSKQVVFSADNENYKPKLYSPVGNAPFSAGMVLPASCESGFEHYAGECSIPAPTCSVAFNLASINLGQSTTMNWNFSNNTIRFVDNCSGDLGAVSGTVPPTTFQGTKVAYPIGSQLCNVTVYDLENRTGSCSAFITILPTNGACVAYPDPVPNVSNNNVSTCTSGLLANFIANETNWTWQCLGTEGMITAACSAEKLNCGTKTYDWVLTGAGACSTSNCGSVQSASYACISTDGCGNKTTEDGSLCGPQPPSEQINCQACPIDSKWKEVAP